jgi:hypothetical protein
MVAYVFTTLIGGSETAEALGGSGFEVDVIAFGRSSEEGEH